MFNSLCPGDLASHENLSPSISVTGESLVEDPFIPFVWNGNIFSLKTPLFPGNSLILLLAEKDLGSYCHFVSVCFLMFQKCKWLSVNLSAHTVNKDCYPI